MREIKAASPFTDDAWRVAKPMAEDELFVRSNPTQQSEPLPSHIDTSERELGQVAAGDRFWFDKQH